MNNKELKISLINKDDKLHISITQQNNKTGFILSNKSIQHILFEYDDHIYTIEVGPSNKSYES